MEEAHLLSQSLGFIAREESLNISFLGGLDGAKMLLLCKGKELLPLQSSVGCLIEWIGLSEWKAGDRGP